MDVLSLIVLAAEQAGTEEHDKTAFYVIGGVLAIYAVLVSALGLARHDFPSSRGALRGVMLLGSLLVAATVASSVLTA